MRQVHRAEEKLFVDYCGQTVQVIDQPTGEVQECQVFVAVLGASNFTYAEATYMQSLPDWIGSHVWAESGVQLVQRWILAALRNRTFFSLAELNAAIRELLDKFNNKPFKKLSGSHMSRFLEIDKPALS